MPNPALRPMMSYETIPTAQSTSRWSPALERALVEASDGYSKRNPRSRRLFERAQLSMPGGNTRSVLAYDPFPLYIARSAGARVIDVDGHDYLDLLCEYSAGLYGHNDPTIRRAIAVATKAGSVNGGPLEAEISFAEAMRERFPSIRRIRFCNSATEANIYAVSLAQFATKRETIICFAGGYHGGVMGFPTAGNPLNVPFDWRIARYNDIEGTRAMIQSCASTLAAIIVEPMMSNGGSIPASESFLEMLRAEATAIGAVLIFDEVVTSRMGAGGMQGLYDIQPDLTTFGKYLGGGFPFGAFGGTADLMDWFDQQRFGGLLHAGTFNNNVFSMTAGLAGLQHVFTKQRATELFAAGDSLRTQLNELAADLQVSAQFTGCGSIMNLHFTRKPIHAPDDAPCDNNGLLKLFHLDMFERQIYLARRGMLSLSLPMTGSDIAHIIEAVGHFLKSRRAFIEATVSGDV